MEKVKEITYLDTYCEGEYSYQDYLEWCEEEEVEPGEEGGEDYWDWIGRQIEQDVECFFENLKYAKDVNGPCVVTGSLGLWDGRHEIEPKGFNELERAVKTCWGSGDDVQVKLKDGVLYVKSMHHDGSNYFEIRPLTERGAELMDNGDEICIGNHWHTGKYPKYLY